MKRLIIFLILLAAAAVTVHRHHVFFLVQEVFRKQTADKELIADAHRNLGYVLSDDGWLTFPLAGVTERLKIVTNATVDRKHIKEYGAEYQYSLEYEIVGADQENVLKTDHYYHTTRLTRYTEPGAEDSHSAFLYIDPEKIPLDSRALTLNSLEWPMKEQAESIRVRLREKESRVTDVLLRVYTIEERTRAEELYNWQRLSIPWRRKQARGNIYPYDYLSDREKLNLMYNRWRPVGPLGTPGRDYRVRILYSLKDYEKEPVTNEEQQDIVFIDSRRVMTLAIPPGGARLKVICTPVEQEVKTEPDIVILNWYGMTAAERQVFRGRSDSTGTAVIESFFDQGLLELRADTPFRVNISQNESGHWGKWLPEPLYSRSTLCDQQADVQFTLSPMGQQPTPLRLTLRVPVSEDTPGEYAVDYEFLGVANGTGVLHFSPEPSLYDRIAVHGTEVPVSEPVRFYWHLPPQVTGIRLSSKSPVLVAASTRPADLAHYVRVPEDYVRTSVTDAKRLPVWFPILPDEYREDIRRQRSILLHVQQRPPQDDPNLAAGLYLYETLRPASQWTGRYLFLPPDPSPHLRDPAPATLYFPLRKQNNVLRFIDRDGVDFIRPRLLFFKDGKGADEKVALSLDGKPYFEARLYGPNGQFELPSLAVGTHTLSVTSSGSAHLFVNHLHKDGAGQSLRFANRLTEQGVSFDYRKDSDAAERLSFTFFSAKATKRSIIRVRLFRDTSSSLRPARECTQLDRRFDIRAAGRNSVHILALGNNMVGPGEKFYVQVGQDIPRGKYRIQVQLEDGPPGYFILSRTTPGVFFPRRLRREYPLPEPVEISRE